MERNLAYEADPQAFRQQWMEQELALSRQIETARQLVESVVYTRRNLLAIAALTSSMQVDGHRSDLVILKAAKAHAALEGRQSIQDLDIALAAELALPHRLRKGPFQQSEISLAELQERIEDIQSEVGAAEQVQPEPAEEEEGAPKKVGAKA
jgi:Mg-chelatase subunit ChlI